MNKFLRVFIFEFKNLIKKKSFLISTFVMAIIVLIITVLPMMFNTSETEGVLAPISMSDRFNESGFIVTDLNDQEAEIILSVFELDDHQVYASRDELVDDLEAEELEVGIIIHSLTEVETLYLNRSMTVEYESIVNAVLKDVYRNTQYEQMGINKESIDAIENTVIENEMTILGRDSLANYSITYVATFVVYMILVLYGSMTATTVAREKDDRTMELLITSTKPTQLILGKVAAVSLVTIAQVGVIVLAGVIGFIIAKESYPEFLLSFLQSSLSPDVVWLMVFYYLAGYILYMFIFAAVGSMVSRVEDVQNVTMPILMIIMVSMAIPLFSFTGALGGVIRFASIFPLTSFMTMPPRYLMMIVSSTDLILSIALLIVSVVFFAYLSIQIYRWGSLYYGNKISLFKVIKQVFSKK